MSPKKNYRKPKRPPQGKKERRKHSVPYARPKIDPGLSPAFQKIGAPEQEPFTADPFQREAVDHLKECDVLVTAPTGSGKTWIASEAIHAYRADGLRAWYASPLKALSNSIYQELIHEFGAQQCGILTGDRKENPDAPIIVGTTEILRNQLYDAMHSGLSLHTDVVVLDEAHYLSDPERGVVWEEVLIYLPPRIRLLLLSATISNAEEVCAWLKQIRGTSPRVVRSEERPVPLKSLFLFPSGLVTSLGTKKGLNPKVKRFLKSTGGKKRRFEKVDYGRILRCLRKLDLLPAIFFLKSRADCDRALRSCPPVRKSEKTQQQLKKGIQSFLKDYPHLRGHRQMRSLVDARVTSHHGGQLPYWKVLVERMMNQGLLEAIFSTSTVAAGVNFPARTVVLFQSDRFNGHEFVNLRATDLHQMIGRAGRRGKDRIGFAMVIPGPYQDPYIIHHLEHSPPDPLMSQIRINFSMTLNLLLSHAPLEVKDLLERSFAAFQKKDSGRELWVSFKRHLEFLKQTGFVDQTQRLTFDGQWASNLRLDQPLLIAEAIRTGAFDQILPETIAAGLAPFVWDRDQEVDIRMDAAAPDLSLVEGMFHNLIAHIADIQALKNSRGFKSPPLMFWPAAALFMWAGGASWEALLRFVPITEGDMASLIMRTADHLRQVAALHETHPQLAAVAGESVGLILREPVYIV
ncbi:MAG: DEAD/DEAH box helicase [Thermodesulfobacteriota bacterium]